MLSLVAIVLAQVCFVGLLAVVCPFWLGYFIDDPLRTWLTTQPRAMARAAARFVGPGSRCADVGCGQGANTLLLAALVGPEGRVYASDIQPAMLQRTRERARRRGLEPRIEFVRCTAHDPGLPSTGLDFVLLSAVLHEVPDKGLILQAVYDALRPGGKLLLTEPPVHVNARAFALEAAMACEIGFRHTAAVPMGFFNALSFEKPNDL
jgi:ubiquinone/menaquinone biosynthesis C-methylase UbiE